MTMIDLI